jgi:Xaa-Pro aminopeptidase
MSELAVFAERRTEYMERIGDRAVAVFHSPPEVLRNGDAHFPFRQSSDLYYLSGFREPETTIVLRPGAESERFVMFVRPRDPEREVWDGRRAGVDGAQETYGADAAYPVSELGQRLPELVANTDDLHYSLGVDLDFDRKITAMMATLRMRERRGRKPPHRVVDPRAELHEMRLVKKPDEIALLRKAAEVTSEAHIEAMKQAAPGVFEYELEAALDYTFRRRGGTGPGYTSIVGAGVNATILHYIENNCELSDGDLILIDAGCEFDLYTADVTRTFPANGTFNEHQRKCYELVLSVQEEAIRMTKPGATIDEIHDHCVRGLTSAMIELGLIEGPVDEAIEAETYRRFYMHRTSHWLGMDVHDVGSYNRDGKARPLEAGMVITIEPGLYIPDEEDIPEPLRGIGIRIEDDILVTADGHENLTSSVPKTVAEVEAASQN